MPKKKRKDAKDDEGDVADTNAEESLEESEVTTSTEDVLWEKIENLKEKRTSVRTASLRSLIESFQNYQTVPLLNERSDDLIANVTSLIKKSSSEEEVILACKLLGLTALTLRTEGLDGHALLIAWWPTLQTMMKNPAKPLEARVAAVEAVSIMCWCDLLCEALDEKDYSEIIAQLDAFLAPETLPPLMCASLDALCLLLSQAPEAQLAGSIFSKYVVKCSVILAHPTLEVKESAGFLLALIQEASMLCENPDEKVDITEDVVDMETVIERLNELATESSRRIAKKDRAKQKSFFREILRTVEDSESPTEEMVIMQVNHEFNGWREILQLKTMRHTLCSGLLAHLVKNPLIADVFQVAYEDPDYATAGTPQQKKAGKQRRQHEARDQFHEREKGRKKKQAAMNCDFDE